MVSGSYATRYNRRYRLVRHLFQGRYNALLVEAECGEYLQTVSSYIHLNPVRARIVGVEGLGGYAWSSLQGYLKGKKRSAWLEVDRVLGSFGLEDTSAGRRSYLDYLKERALEERGANEEIQNVYASIRRGLCYGREKFREQVMREGAKIGMRSRRSCSGGAIEAHDEQAAERLLKAELNRVGVTEEELRKMTWQDGRKRALARLLRSGTIVTNAWVAARLGGGHESTVSRAVHEQG